jgi:hypothetical protein
LGVVVRMEQVLIQFPVQSFHPSQKSGKRKQLAIVHFKAVRLLTVRRFRPLVEVLLGCCRMTGTCWVGAMLNRGLLYWQPGTDLHKLASVNNGDTVRVRSLVFFTGTGFNMIAPHRSVAVSRIIHLLPSAQSSAELPFFLISQCVCLPSSSCQRLNRKATPSDRRQRPAYSVQSLAKHFRVDSHANTEVIGQTEKMSGHG